MGLWLQAGRDLAGGEAQTRSACGAASKFRLITNIDFRGYALLQTHHRPIVLVHLLAIALAAALVLVVPKTASAQQHQLQITSVVTTNWPSVEVTATIVDPTGQPITGLGAQNFNVRSGASALPVTGVTTTSDPGVGIAVVLVFDVSGSMAG